MARPLTTVVQLMLPFNPSDAIYGGAPIPTLPPIALTQRRPFNMATKTPLHYSEGAGPDEYRCIENDTEYC